ncbi:hypothetical protein GCM10010517_49590 [Streptosporangium fragile]|uniref:Uncharacterized protein n=1 Tax=Streptosporangium fragile TaxID=46186 RepID=A0ABN3W3S5_9ACTN
MPGPSSYTRRVSPSGSMWIEAVTWCRAGAERGRTRRGEAGMREGADGGGRTGVLRDRRRR